MQLLFFVIGLFFHHVVVDLRYIMELQGALELFVIESNSAKAYNTGT